MILIVFKYLTTKGFRGFAFYPFIFLSSKEDKNDEVFMNHEKIHIRQQLELLILPFYVWYLLEYLFRLMMYQNSKKAYLSISFEREAYANESNLQYLNKRAFWSFLKYL